MKILSNKEMNKMAKSALAMVIAGTITFSAAPALAEENTNELEQYETVELNTEVNSEIDAKASVGTENMQKAIEEAEAPADDLKEEAPALLPGDFFYFAKLSLEKIKLAFAFNQEKEAKLLAIYAAERLAEAEALFSEGNEDKALDAIEKAIEFINNSDQIVEEESNEATVEASPAPKQDQTEDGTAEEAADEDAAAIKEEQDNDGENPFAEIEELLSQNIIALTAAMEKVENPVAKAALEKNIEKSYVKLAKKLEKLESKFAEKEIQGQKNEDTADEASADTDSAAEIPTQSDITVETEAEADKELSVQTLPAVKPGKAANPEVKQIKKEAAQEAKAIKAEVKQEATQKRQDVQQEIKQKRENMKQEVKQKREETQQEVKSIKNELKETIQEVQGDGNKGKEKE